MSKQSPTADFIVPQTWDEPAIVRQINKLSAHPTILSHFIASMKERFITAQDAKTTQKRTEFLRIQLEHRRMGLDDIRVSKDVATEMYDIQLLEAEQELRKLELAAKTNAAKSSLKDQEELAELGREEKKLEIKLRMAKIQKEMADLQKVPDSSNPQPLTPEEKRSRNRIFWENRIQRLQHDKGEAIFKITKGRPFQELSEEDQAEVILISNMYDDAVQRAREELKKYL